MAWPSCGNESSRRETPARPQSGHGRRQCRRRAGRAGGVHPGYGGCSVTAAGIATGGGVLEVVAADRDRVSAVNLKGTWLGARAVLPAMLAPGAGSQCHHRLPARHCRQTPRHRFRHLHGCHDQPGLGSSPGRRRPGFAGQRESARRRGDAHAGAGQAPQRRRVGRAGHIPRPPCRRALRQTGEMAQAGLHLASDEAGFTIGAVLPVDGGCLVA